MFYLDTREELLIVLDSGCMSFEIINTYAKA